MDKTNFYESRMQLLEVTEENNKMWIENPDAEFPEPKRREVQIFTEDKDGNIRINFCRLDGSAINYVKMGTGKMSHINGKRMEWFQTRLKEPKGDKKYIMPSGQGTYPFFPSAIRNAWRKKEKIVTLVLTEGAFKAWLACLKNIMCVGLTSITHYRDKETGELHHDIQRLIIDCQVENLVILWDGDCLNISEKQLFNKEDIAKRPSGFFYAAKNIKELAEEIELPEDREKLKIYFYHVKSDCFEVNPKGLDDLLIEAKKANKVEAVVKEIHQVDKQKSFYFEKRNITTSTHSLYHYFGLHNVDFFYHFHSEIIKLHEFIFRSDIYQYEEGKNKVEMVAPAWAKNVKWIGDDFFKIVNKPRAKGEYMLYLDRRKKQTLVDLYGKDFQKHIQYYEGFCNVPDHFNYKQVHGRFYNRYNPFQWTPKEGTCQTSIDFVKHIFGENEIEHDGKVYQSWELGLDYLQLLITNPTQILPVLILYSPENNTGKSTFGKWERMILGHNSIQIGNQDFKSEFNDHWTDKLLAICEETLLERKKEAEVIKAYATSNSITVNPKNMGKFEIDFFCKFQFYSNNARMIYVSKYDERFWIIKVPVPKKDNPTLLKDLESEIPAFLHFLVNRKLSSEQESRMWFNPCLIRTETFMETVKVNEPTDARNLREKIKEMFLDFGMDKIYMPQKNINNEFFNGRSNIPWIKEILHDYLNVGKVMGKGGKVKQMRGSYPKWEKAFDEQGNEYLRKTLVKFNDRPYVFLREDYVTDSEETEEDEDVTSDDGFPSDDWSLDDQ